MPIIARIRLPLAATTPLSPPAPKPIVNGGVQKPLKSVVKFLTPSKFSIWPLLMTLPKGGTMVVMLMRGCAIKAKDRVSKKTVAGKTIRLPTIFFIQEEKAVEPGRTFPNKIIGLNIK